ncbi:hypothetical protein N0V85_002562 [Neurospora sp. IMI 360204]|nr:hypothetical protein N0V85_002562 [Neurospora sp. IMI 360204]
MAPFPLNLRVPHLDTAELLSHLQQLAARSPVAPAPTAAPTAAAVLEDRQNYDSVAPAPNYGSVYASAQHPTVIYTQGPAVTDTVTVFPTSSVVSSAASTATVIPVTGATSDHTGGLSGGAIAGIVIGVVIFLILLLLLFWWLGGGGKKKRRDDHYYHEEVLSSGSSGSGGGGGGGGGAAYISRQTRRTERVYGSSAAAAGMRGGGMSETDSSVWFQARAYLSSYVEASFEAPERVEA